MTLVRVVAPHFVAGIVARDGVVIDAAPILSWSIGKTQNYLTKYFNKKGWTYESVCSFDDPAYNSN